jgi:hypothetical protein
MKTLFFTLIYLLGLSSVAFANDVANDPNVADQTWTCVLDTASSQVRLKAEITREPTKYQPSADFHGISVSDLKAFQVVIQNGKIADGYAQGLERSDLHWDFKSFNPSSSIPNNQSYSFVQPQVTSSGEITLAINSDGWDHFNYEIVLDPNSKTAEVHESIEIDCLGSSLGIAVYSCHQ